MIWINIVVFILGIVFFVICKMGIKEEGKLFLRKHRIKYLVIFCFNLLGIIFGVLSQEECKKIVIEKEGYSGKEQEILLELSKGEEKKDVILNISPKTYKKEEALSLMEEAFEYLEKNMKGNNESLDRVEQDLDLSLDEEKYPFLLECTSDCYRVVTDEGIVKNDKENLEKNEIKNPEAGIKVNLTVKLSYNQFEKTKDYRITVYPKSQSLWDEKVQSVIDNLEALEKENRYEENLELPIQLEGINIKRTDKKNVESWHVLGFGVLIAGLLWLKEQEEEKERKRKRREVLSKSYPWFVNELVLLLGAGMQVKNIFRLLVKEGENDNELIKELKQSCNNLDMGMAEEQVYYQLGRRLQLPCYIKLMTLLEQNVKKGSKGITNQLEQEEGAALEERKNMAKRYGEEASTKLLGPMILLLLIIMLIIMIPAFMSFQ